MHLKDQRTVKAVLEKLQREERCPGGLLFYGLSGVGKTTASLDLARGLLCQEKEVWGCGRCHSCRLMEPISEKILSGEWEEISTYEDKDGKRVFLYLAGEHPDFVFLPPSGSYIRIDQIRAVKEFVFKKPALSEKKVVVIDSADSMTKESANALLKVLEEPPLDTHFILTTSSKEAILPTILSRTHSLEFSPLEEDTFYQILGTQDKDLYIRSLGSVTAARRLVEHKEVLSIAEDILGGDVRRFTAAVARVDSLDTEEKELLIYYLEEGLRKALLEKGMDYDKFEACMRVISDMSAGISRGIKLSLGLCLLHSIWR